MTVSPLKGGRANAAGMTSASLDAPEVDRHLNIAQGNSRAICRKLLNDLENAVNELHEVLGRLQRAELGDASIDPDQVFRSALALLREVKNLAVELRACTARPGLFGEPPLTRAESEKLKRLLERARKSLEAADLPIPDELFAKALAGDPGAVDKLRGALRHLGATARESQRITVEIMLLLVGLMGAMGRRPAF